MAISAIALLLFLCGAARGDNAADAIIGSWYTEDQEAIFEFYRVEGEYRARLIPLAIPDMIDSLNPVDSLKTRPIAGATTIRGLRYNPEKQRWEGGTVYNPSNGKTYSCTCRLIGTGTEMEFRGYLGISLLGQTQVWVRKQRE